MEIVSTQSVLDVHQSLPDRSHWAAWNSMEILLYIIYDNFWTEFKYFKKF